MLESRFQPQILGRIETMFPGCVIQKLDANYQQGIPDWLILYKDRWAVLEIKASANARQQPNQDWWVAKLDGMSFGAFVFPENAEEVLHDLQLAFQTRRAARLS